MVWIAHWKSQLHITIAVRKNLGKETRREMNLMGLFISLLRHLTCFCFPSYGSFWRGCRSGKDKQSGWLISAAVPLPSPSMLPLSLGRLPLPVLLFFASVFSLRGPQRKKTVILGNGEAFMCHEWGRWAKVELAEGCADSQRGRRWIEMWKQSIIWLNEWGWTDWCIKELHVMSQCDLNTKKILVISCIPVLKRKM